MIASGVVRPTIGFLLMSYGMEQIPDKEKKEEEEEVRGSKVPKVP